VTAPPERARTAFRLVVEDARDGAANMAVDEALLEAYGAPDPPARPTLRLYGWTPPALSLGSRQPAAGAHERAYLRAENIDLVRRPTGGRAVLHEYERTYAVAGALGRPPFAGGVVDTYRSIARALLAGLRRLGLEAEACEALQSEPDPGPLGFPVCFDRPGAFEIAVAGRKLVGSAQLRRRGAFLQHGSIPLRADAARLSRAIGVGADATRFTDLETALGRPVAREELDRALCAGFAAAFEADLVAGALSEGESARAAQLRCWKYDSAAWTLEGRVGERERRWGPPL
jgi:lipoate-protein ligase A